ncbi:MAG: hypothetical protein Q9168_002534 [Polycauliona sp. 1 TL-2023]
MGNPNRRVTVKKPVLKPEDTKPIVKPLPSPPPAPKVRPCTGACGVRNWHDENATWTLVTDQKVPAIVKVKQGALKDAVQARNFGQARNIHYWLARFYSYHGPYDTSGMDQLPQIPELSKTGKDAA